MIRRVLILRPDNLGDIVLFSGALRHLREHYPHAEILLSVQRYVRNILELCPYVDKLIEWEDLVRPPLNLISNKRGGWRLNAYVRYLMNHRYSTDILLLPVRSPTAGLFGMHATVRSIRAKEKYGISGDFCCQRVEDDEAADQFYTKRLHLSVDRRWEHEFYVTCDFLRLLGIKVSADDLWPEFWTDVSDHHWAQQTISHQSGALTLAICPGVIAMKKLYPAANYAEVIHCLQENRFHIVLFGSEAEKEICAQVAASVQDCKNVISTNNLCGQTSLLQLVEGLSACEALLSVDSAALHIAVALHKPTVGIMGGGHYGRFYPWGDPGINRVANIAMDCYWCDWKCRYPTIRCIQEIPPQKIGEELRLALKAGGLLN